MSFQAFPCVQNRILNTVIKAQETASSADTDDHPAGQYCCSNWHPDAVMKLQEALLRKWTVTENSQHKFKGKYHFATHENDQKLHIRVMPIRAGIQFKILSDIPIPRCKSNIFSHLRFIEL